MNNPVFRREINTMFRSYKIFIGIGVYALVMLSLTALILFNVIFNKYNGFNPKEIIYLFCVIVGFQTGVVFLVVPAFSSSAISGERERQTLDLMLLTKMTPFTIVVGKLLSSLLLLSVMIIITMPIYAIVFYYGGISIFDLFIALIFDFSYAMMIGSMAIVLSSIFKKNVTATVLSYIIIVFFPFISFTIISFILSIYYYNHDINNIPILLQYLFMASNPVLSFISLVVEFMGKDFNTYFLGNSMASDLNIKIWQITIAFNIILTFIFLKLSAKIINPIKNRKK